MSKQINLAPSILSADFANLGRDMQQVEATWRRLDPYRCDGRPFRPNLSMGLPVVAACKRVTDLFLDVHLMIEYPERYVEQFAEAGADGITIHAEASPNLHRTLQAVRATGLRAGVAINPGTMLPPSARCWQSADMVLVMTVNPGYSGQTFIPETMTKVKKIRKWIEKDGLETDIQVDGGIDAETLPIARQAGANVFVAASAIFKHPDGSRLGIRAAAGPVKVKNEVD